jgi:membrane-associated phospholipid phosphatase
MESINNLEIIINTIFQSIGTWLKLPALFFTFLGKEEFYFLVMPVFYWCVEAGLGLRIALMLAFSNFFNGVLKVAFHGPRPYWIDPQVQALSSETSFGMPSGHAQTAASVWGMLGVASRRTWGIVLAGVVAMLIGLSRVYLGVHFLSDVLAGWVIGAVLLFAFVRLDRPVTTWIGRLTFRQVLVVCISGATVIVLALLAVNLALGAWQVPEAWVANALAAGAEPINPRSPEGAYTLGGTWLGITAGAAWLFRKAGGFAPDKSVVKRALSYLVGALGVVILWYGLGKVFPRQEDLLSYALRFFRYTLVGVWVSAGAPWLFKRLRLVK